MSENKDKFIIDSTEQEEFQEIVAELKQNFRNKLENKLISIHNNMKDEFAVILGDEFSSLIEERGNILLKFRRAEAEMLQFAVSHCDAKEEFDQLVKWVDIKDDLKKKAEIGKQIFSVIKEKVEKINPQIVENSDDIHRELEFINGKIRKVVDDHRPQLEDVEKKYRSLLQNDIVDFVVEYNKQLREVERGFNIVPENQTIEESSQKSPFDGDYQMPTVEVTVFDDNEDDFFIPLKSEDDILN